MTDQDIRILVAGQLGRIAPEIPFDSIDPSEDLREECDIDSLDFLTLITALGKELSLLMPEADYDQMRTLDDLLAYLGRRTA
jgi:acyl carrier protein